jgi:hypothetical protein
MSGGGGSSSDSGGGNDRAAAAKAAMTSQAAYTSSASPATAPKRDSDSVSGSNNNDQYTQDSLRRYEKSVVRSPELGDPDPEVDVPTKKRQDTVTSFTKNLQANVKANPLMATPGGMLYTALQTGAANAMLGNFDPTRTTAEQRDTIREATPLAPYAMRGEIAPESQAMNWYRTLGENTQTAFNFSEGYATAKARQQGILGTPTPIRYHAVSESPFFNWLKDNSLNKGIL